MKDPRFYVCNKAHDEVRWAWAGGEYCWMCGAAGEPFDALLITSPLTEVDERWIPSWRVQV